MYNVFGERLTEFPVLSMVYVTCHTDTCNSIVCGMLQEDGRETISECHMWPNGLVVLTRTNKLFAVNELSSESPVKVTALAHVPADDLGGRPPTAMTIIEPQFTRSNSVEVSATDMLLAWSHLRLRAAGAARLSDRNNPGSNRAALSRPRCPEQGPIHKGIHMERL